MEGGMEAQENRMTTAQGGKLSGLSWSKATSVGKSETLVSNRSVEGRGGHFP